MMNLGARAAILAVLAILLGSPAARAQAPSFLSAEQRNADFSTLCDFVAEQYAYFDRHHIDWPRACAAHAPRAAAAADRTAFVQVLERALAELYDAHAHLGTNTPTSPRLVPSQTDLVAAWQGERALVTSVRAGSAAAAAGLRPGMEVLAIEGQPVQGAAAAFAPSFLAQDDTAARAYALQQALAGRHDRPTVHLHVRDHGQQRDVVYRPAYPQAATLLSWQVLGGVGHLRLNNSLGETTLVAAFDDALFAMGPVQAWVLDLRDTPSGGNTTVARGLMGRLVAQPQPYQRHEAVAEFRSTGIRRSWVEWVSPRGQHFLKPMVVLVGPWTGSMGEGLAIGLNAARGAPVLGQPMARLLGALDQTTLAHSGIVVRVPAEKLSHIDGTPREDFVPCSLQGALPRKPAADGAQDGAQGDAELKAAIAWVRSPRSGVRHCPTPRRRAALPASR